MKYIALLVLGFVTVLAQDPPPFLAGAPAEDVQKFYDLLKNDESKTDPQIDADIEAFVTSLGGDYKQKFDEFKQQLKEGQAEYEKAHQAAIANFSPEAKEADAKMTAIADDPNLSGVEKRDQIKAVMDSLSESVRNEILTALNGPQQQ